MTKLPSTSPTCCASVRSRASALSTRLDGIRTRSSAPLCAFANDFENLGGAYVVIGQDGTPKGNRCSRPLDWPTTSSTRFSRNSWQPAN